MGIAWRERIRELRTVPNLVTFSRLPLLLVLVLVLDTAWRYPVFALIVFTDGFDGWLARRLDQETELGAMLDPTFDKLIALLLFTLLFPRTDLPLDYLILFFARDAFIVSLLAFIPVLAFDAEDVKASMLGRAVTNIQFVTMIAMLVSHTPATQLLMWVLGVVSVFAIADYVVVVGRNLTARGYFQSRESVVAVYVVTVLVFVAVVWLVLLDELRETLDVVL